MLILALRTDRPKAELAIFEDSHLLNKLAWLADRKLAATLNLKIDEVLAGRGKQLHLLSGIVYFSGPGSFTGLRIGASVANALAYSQNIPIVSVTGPSWQQSGITRLLEGKNDHLVMPCYDRRPATTSPRR